MFLTIKCYQIRSFDFPYQRHAQLMEKSWSLAWEYDGMRISDRVRVWLDGYSDRDFEQVFLLRVWTKSDPAPSGKTVTITDHLAVYKGIDSSDPANWKSTYEVEWRDEARLFFDVDPTWVTHGLQWWAEWLALLVSIRGRASQPDALTDKHNRKIEAEQRAPVNSDWRRGRVETSSTARKGRA